MTRILYRMAIINAVLLALGFALMFLCAPAEPQTPCKGKTARDQCACLGMDYNKNLTPVPGCVVRPQSFDHTSDTPPELTIEGNGVVDIIAGLLINPSPKDTLMSAHDYALDRLKKAVKMDSDYWKYQSDGYHLFTYQWTFKGENPQGVSIGPDGKVELDNISAEDAILLLVSDIATSYRDHLPSIAPATPEEVCRRNSLTEKGWEYIAETNTCLGPSTLYHAPVSPEPLCRFHTRRDGKRAVSEWMPCKQITKCRKPCWIEKAGVK